MNKSMTKESRAKTPSTPTLCLSGSQVNLTPRPNSNLGRASARSLSLSRKRRPMSAVLLSTQSSCERSRVVSKPRPKSADITKCRVQGHSMDDESFGETWDAIENATSSFTLHSSPGWITPDLDGAASHLPADNSLDLHFERQSDDALLDKLLEGAVQEHTKKQLRFAQTEEEEQADLFNLAIPAELISDKLTNPSEDFISDLVDDIKHSVRDSYSFDDEFKNKPLAQEQIYDDFEAQKKLIEKVFAINDTPRNKSTATKPILCKRQRKPRSIAELLQIIDCEIPRHFTQDKSILKKTKAKVNEAIVAQETLTPGNAAEYQEVFEERKNFKVEPAQTVLENQVEEKINVPDKEISADQFKDIKKSETTSTTEETHYQHHDAKNMSIGGVSDIMNFLDEVERSDEASREEERETRQPYSQTNDLDEMSSKNGGVGEGRHLRSLRQALEERTAHVQLLRETLQQARLEATTALAEAGKEHRAVQRKLKADHESALKKLQNGMDKLLADKRQLMEKVEALLQQVRGLDGKHQSHVQALQQRHVVDVARAKELAAAAEKVRRERWVERQTARIKELTVKGLEPELTRLNLQHENKIAQLQAAHARELQTQTETETRHMEQLRAALLKDKDEELARERSMLNERFDRQLAEERAAQERRCERLTEDASAEAARLRAASSAQREAFELQAQQEAQRVKAAHEQHIAQIEERKQIELAVAREELREEQRVWVAAQTRAHNEALAARQVELRAERDAEIERAIERLDTEERNARVELERELEKKIERLREQHAALLADRELSERLLRARLDDAQSALQDSEQQLLAARASESRLKQELCISMQRVEVLENEQARVRAVVEEQFAERVSELETALQQQKEERRNELEQLNTRLRGVMEKKDHHIEQLKRQEAEIKTRCRHLESLLGRQPL